MAMEFTYEGRTETIDETNLGLAEGLAIQKITSWKLPQFLDEIKGQNMLAVCAFAYAILKFRFGMTDLKFSDIENGTVTIPFNAFNNPDAPQDGKDEPGKEETKIQPEKE